MQALLKMRWVFLALWTVLLTVLLMFVPDMEQLVRDKGNITIPNKYSSMIANEILDRHHAEGADTVSAVLIFHDKKGIGASKEKEVDTVLNALQNKQKQLGIAKITTYRDGEQVRQQLVSKDKKTIITSIEIDRKGRSIAEIRDDLEKAVGNPKIDHYFTGGHFIEEDVMVSSQNSLHKAEIITIIFILFVLVLVFRSIVTPLIPLLTVGVSYVASAAIVAYLVNWFNFPISTFTQIFMVATLFGIGTDYCILLLSRFKEELPKHETVTEAIIKTYQTAGRTVLFSALAVLIGFVSIALSKFSLYQSATGVAIGIVVLLVALVTIVPSFMYTLGPRLFWPVKSASGHSESKIWGAFGNFSIRKPLHALLLVIVVVVPLVVSYDGRLSFNSLNEIGEGYGSVKGFNTIADSFGPGKVMPVQVIVEGKEKLDSEEALTTIEKVSREIMKLSSVEKVQSATRPLGDPVENFYVADQAKTLNDGIGKGTESLNQIKDGLVEAKSSLAASTPQLNSAAGGVNQLISGTRQLQNGVGQIQTALSQIENGMRKGSIGVSEIKHNLALLRQQVEKSQSETKQQVEEFQKLAKALRQLGSTYNEIYEMLDQAAINLNVEQLQVMFAALEQNYEDLGKDPTYQDLKKQVLGSAVGIKDVVKQLNEEINTIVAQVNDSERIISSAIAQQEQLAQALQKLEEGAAKLESGNAELVNAQNKVIGKLPEASSGLAQLENGQSQLKDGFASVNEKLALLQSGLGQSTDGLGQISNGLHSAQSYLGGLAQAPDKEMAGFYIPSEALESGDLQQVFDNYLSKDKEVAKFDVVLKYNPYSAEAQNATKDIQAVVKRTLADTDLKDAEVGVSGVSASAADMLAASNSDYKQTVIYMLIGITLILIVLLRSIVMPLYLIVSLALCFFSSLAINEVIFVNILGYDGINWTMPFFGFVLLMALGVDYSIFLMDRFNEYKGTSVNEAILLAMRNMGPVIFSAVIILGGTFAALYPSGVLSLMQIATIVLSGLLLYVFVFLPFFVPVMVKLFGKANWFPFERNLNREESKRDIRM
ncbi:MMPL family transporter [Bacillus sp. OTU530]|uniref:MMPL family transporter n=1 Tax=Bacillus sp. OTU530 TaxID=3043862 RepID=UPI00313B2A36